MVSLLPEITRRSYEGDLGEEDVSVSLWAILNVRLLLAFQMEMRSKN